MLRWAGFVLCVLASVLAGMGSARRLERRIETISALDRMLESLKGALCYTLSPVDQLLAYLMDTAPDAAIPFLRQVAAERAAGCAFPAAWRRGAEASAAALALRVGDLEPLVSVGGILGTADLETQLAQLSLLQGRIQNMLADAEKTDIIRGKLYRTLGILGGMGMVILFW